MRLHVSESVICTCHKYRTESNPLFRYAARAINPVSVLYGHIP
jgi:hypothetical protein